MNAGNELNFRGGHQQLRECGVQCIDLIQVSAPTLCSFGVLACIYMVHIVWCSLVHNVHGWHVVCSFEFGAQVLSLLVRKVSAVHCTQCAQIVQLWRIYRVCSAIYTWGASSAADSDAAGKDYGCRISEQLQKMCIITFECASLPRC